MIRVTVVVVLLLNARRFILVTRILCHYPSLRSRTTVRNRLCRSPACRVKSLPPPFVLFFVGYFDDRCVVPVNSHDDASGVTRMVVVEHDGSTVEKKL